MILLYMCTGIACDWAMGLALAGHSKTMLIGLALAVGAVAATWGIWWLNCHRRKRHKRSVATMSAAELRAYDYRGFKGPTPEIAYMIWERNRHRCEYTCDMDPDCPHAHHRDRPCVNEYDRCYYLRDCEYITHGEWCDPSCDKRDLYAYGRCVACGYVIRGIDKDDWHRKTRAPCPRCGEPW